MPSLEDFEEYLRSEGYEGKSMTTYRNAVGRAFDVNPAEPWRILESASLTSSTKNVYRIALRHWADFTEDDALYEQLGSRAVKKLLSARKSRRGRGDVQPLPEEQTRAFLDAVEAHRDDKAHPWLTPTIMVMIRLALRAGVDLTYITRAEMKRVVVEGGYMSIITKGGRARKVPAEIVKDELQELLMLSGWKVLADVISPAARPETRHQAAYQAIRHWCKKIAVEAGLDPKDVWTHRFRHTGAHLFQRRGADLKKTSEFLGHRSTRTTERYLRGLQEDEIMETATGLYDEEDDE